jgi:hypothetical protein
MKRWFATTLPMLCLTLSTTAASAQGYTVMGPNSQGAQGTPVIGSAQDRTPTTTVVGAGSSVQLNREPRRPEDYGGVSPGRPSIPPGLRRAQRAGAVVPVVAWPGFQVVPGGSRVFLAVTAQPVITEASRSPRQRVYHIERGRILLSNNRRPLVTEAFNTPLARAWLRPAGRGVDLVLELRADADPTIAQEAGPQGFQVVYVNLPPWQAPEIARVILPNGAAVSVTADPRATPVPGGAPGAPAVTPVVAPARGPMIDNERPPGR